MAKKTRKEIEETIRNKMANKHNEYVETQRRKYGELWDAYCRALKECDKYREENEELKEKVQEYEDWIGRLQEFVDMPEDMRKKEIERMRADQKFKTYLAESPLFKMLGLYSGYDF